MTSWENLYSGIDPYSLSDWYRYLNCGYLVPAVGGTDKMAAVTAVGTVRTYARLDPSSEFTYEAWKDAVRRGETFVTYGPLLEFTVDGQPMGSRIRLSASGGTLDVTWQVASVTVPMTRVELVVNGEIRESRPVAPQAQQRALVGQKVRRSDAQPWLALLVRGHTADKPEIIAAHSSPVMVEVEGSPAAGGGGRGHDPGPDRRRPGLPGHGRHPRRGPGLQADAPGAGIRPSHAAQPHAPAGALPRAPGRRRPITAFSPARLKLAE